MPYPIGSDRSHGVNFCHINRVLCTCLQVHRLKHWRAFAFTADGLKIKPPVSRVVVDFSTVTTCQIENNKDHLSMNIQWRNLPNVRMAPKTISNPVLIIIALMFSVPVTEASWWIDTKKFYHSGHGEITCQECHEDITEQELHPNPDYVNKNLADFIDMESCFACHEDVQDDLDEGVHGEEEVDDLEKYKDCISCHNPHYPETGKPDEETANTVVASELSTPPEDDLACLSCHQAVENKDPQRTQKIAEFCFHCHGVEKAKDGPKTSLIPPLLDRLQYESTSHAKTDCTACHPKAAEYGHGSQPQGDCRQCHTPHEEKVAHDAHSGVTCQACHLDGVAPLRDTETKAVRWEKTTKPGMITTIHDMPVSDDDTVCVRCHFSGNQIGAASMILPAKSILCMPCHAATFSGGDFTTISALVIFLAGLIMTASVWFSGALPGKGSTNPLSKAFQLLMAAVRALFSAKIIPLIKTLFFDVFMQRRLHRRSVKRWVIHGLIFFPFVFRFVWGIVGLFASVWLPDQSITWSLLDKNNPAAAMLFDLTGIMILLGVIFAFLRDSGTRDDRPPGLPARDRWALALIGGIVGIGFILEAMRIAMTGWPPGSGYAVIGYALSKLLSGTSGLVDIYGYVWYIHAVLTGTFIAYLPFSRLMHIIMAPVVLAINAGTDQKHRRM